MIARSGGGHRQAGGLLVSAAVPGRNAPGDGAAPRQWTVLPRLEHGRIGTRAGDGSISVRRRERADTLLFGPFWRLPCGRYRLGFRGSAARPHLPSQPVLGVEIIVLNRDQQAWRDFTAAELAVGECTVEFEVPPELSLEAGEVTPFEFRFLHFANADLRIEAAELHQLDESEAAPAPPRRWRLLGRQWTTLRARCTASGGVLVPRAATGGTVLHGGRPFLWLPEGRYRLDLRGRGDRPRYPAAPVVAVEITAHPLSARSGEIGARRDSVLVGAADFTASELAGGAAAFFTVPRGLSLDGGEDAPFEFRILHLGNAALALDAVEVTAVGEGSEESPEPSRWRLLGRLRARSPLRAADAALSVRRDEPPGPVLVSGRPRPRLNPGKYRLAVGAAAEQPRDAAAPALTVVVSVAAASAAAEPLLLRRTVPLLCRDFTAAELAAGPVGAGFAVPAAPLGADYAFADIRVFHTGNADLRIDTVELHERPLPEAASGRLPAARRNVLVIGNCQADTIRQGFEQAEPLRRRFKSKYQFVRLPKHLHARGLAELRECDLLLVQDIKDWEQYPLKDEIPAGLEIVNFPLLHFASLWPFDHFNGAGDTEAHDREYPNLTFLYLDGLLGRLRKEIPDTEARFRAYRDLSVEGLVNHVRLHDFERRRLEAMDRRFGGDIGRFVLDHFRERQLFYTIAHPNREVLSMLMQRLLHLLGIDEPFPEVAEFDHLKRLQVPVHPKVARDLGVGWADESTAYLYEGRPTSWEAYIRAYIDHYG